MVLILWLIASLTPVSASLGGSMNINADDSSLSNAFGVNSTNESAGSLQVNRENKPSIGNILNETATEMDEIQDFNRELINALGNGTEINITNQANQTYGNLVQVHHSTELQVGDMIVFRTNITNPLAVIIHLLLVNITENSFIFRMVNSSDMNSFVNISVNRTELESSWGNDSEAKTVIRPLQYNETQAEQFLLELSHPIKASNTNGFLEYIKEHKTLISGGAVAALVISGVTLSILISCCSKKSALPVAITDLKRDMPQQVLSTLIPSCFLSFDEIDLRDIEFMADGFFDEYYHPEYGEDPRKVATTKSDYKNKVCDILKANAKVREISSNKRLDIKYTTFLDAKKVFNEVFEKIILK